MKPVVTLVIAAGIFYVVGGWVLAAFDSGNAIRRDALDMKVEGRGTVSVSLSGEDMRRAEGEIKLYPEDRVTTGGSAHATLTAFDGTVLRLDEGSDLRVEESANGLEKSELTLLLEAGGLWIGTPELATFSGSIIRTIRMPSMTLTFPSRTEAVVTTTALTVFSADGLGVQVKLKETGQSLTIGEGQRFTLPPEGTVGNDPYAHRSPIDPTLAVSPFVLESRAALRATAGSNVASIDSASGATTDATGLLTITAPESGMSVRGPTVQVSGRVGANVARVRVNGYQAPVDAIARTFSQEIALPDEDDVTITVEALDERGIMLAKQSKTVRRDRDPQPGVTITAPATAGTTFKTNAAELEIKGAAPAGTESIYVNDYRLQLFQPGDRTWSYLASIRLGNFQQGSNVFRVVAVGAGGVRSEPVELTIVQGDGNDGVVIGGSSSAAATTSSAEQPDVTALPNNDPLRPGTLTVRGPTPGSSHTATGSAFLIEGTTTSDTASVWVNDYMLRLYTPGKTFWNYIANSELDTLKRGTNIYRVVTRNADGQILDRMEYTVTY